MAPNAIEKLDLHMLRALRGLIAHESVTVAARRLRTSQPTMSRMLGSLREALADPLLTPVGRRLEATPFARALGPRLDAAILAIEALAITEHAGLEVTQHVAATDYGFHVVLAPFLASPAGAHARLELHPLTLDTIGAIGRGEVALALAPRVPVRGMEALVRRPLLRDEHVVVMRPQHPLARETLTKKRYLAARHVSVRTDAPGKSQVERALRGESARDVTVRVTSLGDALSVVRATDVLGTFPARFVRAFAPELVQRPVPFEVDPVELFFLFSPRQGKDANHTKLREALAIAVSPA